MAGALPIPKYHQIYLVLRQRVLEGGYAEGLPSELVLMERFGVGRVTVRKALELLVHDGLISRRPGRGTVVHLPPATAAGTPQPTRSRLLDNLVSVSLETSIRVVALETVKAPAAVAADLQLPAGAPVQKAVRVRSTEAGPLSHITTYVPEALAAGFGRADLAREPLLVLLEKRGIQLGNARQTISASLADAPVAEELQVPVGSALLSVHRIVWDAQDRPVQWLHGLYRPDRYEYEMTLSRVGDIDARVWVGREITAHLH